MSQSSQPHPNRMALPLVRWLGQAGRQAEVRVPHPVTRRCHGCIRQYGTSPALAPAGHAMTCARIPANRRCLNLYIVAPRCDGAAAGWTGEARKVACGDSVLDRAVVVSRRSRAGVKAEWGWTRHGRQADMAPFPLPRQVDTLEQALADTSSSIGFTRRTGAARRTHASLGHLLAEFPFALPLQPPPVAVPTSAAAAGPCATALVFGREESGLTEAELRLCRWVWLWL